MRFAILLSLSFLLSSCSSTQEKDTAKALPAPVVTNADTTKPAFEKIQYISEFKQKEKVVASTNLASEEAKISIQFHNKALSKGNYALVLMDDTCQNIQSKRKDIRQSDLNEDTMIQVAEFAAKKGLELSSSIEAKGGLSPKEYLSNRFLAIYSVAKKSGAYTLVACENRQ